MSLTTQWTKAFTIKLVDHTEVSVMFRTVVALAPIEIENTVTVEYTLQLLVN